MITMTVFNNSCSVLELYHVALGLFMGELVELCCTDTPLGWSVGYTRHVLDTAKYVFDTPRGMLENVDFSDTFWTRDRLATLSPTRHIIIHQFYRLAT